MCLLVCAHTSDFGFKPSTFTGIEQGENYRIPIKFISGGVGQGFFSNVNLNLSGTAGKSVIMRLHLSVNHCTDVTLVELG